MEIIFRVFSGSYERLDNINKLNLQALYPNPLVPKPPKPNPNPVKPSSNPSKKTQGDLTC